MNWVDKLIIQNYNRGETSLTVKFVEEVFPL